jgi:membrane protein implicated in regulation of membrane protease activity
MPTLLEFTTSVSLGSAPMAATKLHFGSSPWGYLVLILLAGVTYFFINRRRRRRDRERDARDREDDARGF